MKKRKYFIRTALLEETEDREDYEKRLGESIYRSGNIGTMLIANDLESDLEPFFFDRVVIVAAAGYQSFFL